MFYKNVVEYCGLGDAGALEELAVPSLFARGAQRRAVIAFSDSSLKSRSTGSCPVCPEWLNYF